MGMTIISSMPTYNRFLGELDADTDTAFKSHFVESAILRRIFNNKSNVIYGAKGVGKTALRRALTEINESSYCLTNTINLDQMSFKRIHAAFHDLQETTQTEIPALASNTWRMLLALYCLETVSNILPNNLDLKQEINDFLTDQGFIEEDSHNRMVGQIERLMLQIAEIGVEEKTSPMGLHKRQIAIINSFPTNKKMINLLNNVTNYVRISEKRFILVCLDGFDSIKEHTQESRKAIFTGLIDAVNKYSKDPLFNQLFCFKAFLPQELTEGAFTWDDDKSMYQTHHISWSEIDIQNFLTKRLQHYSRKKSSNFSDIWYEYMPDKITNNIHRVEENSYSYILRHTLYRPRQILAHIQTIINRWDETSTSFRIDSKFIPKVVAETNRILANYVINQFKITYPNVDNFMRSWNGIPNTMTVADFQSRIKKMFHVNDSAELDTIFDDMFKFGIFGTTNRNEIEKGSQQTKFNFGFVGDNHNLNIHYNLENDDLIAIAPIFHEYCNCKPSEFGVVIPA